MFTLRPYQQEAVQAIYERLEKKDDNPVVVIPTGGGKTPVMATLCKDVVQKWSGRVLILAHRKELLQQAGDKLQKVCPEVSYGVYSAGLRQRETNAPVIVAGIQSVYKCADKLGAFDLVLVDEAHLIPPEGEGMYRQFLADSHIVNPKVRVVGLTATPYRMRSGSICAPDYFLNEICYEISVRELIVAGYLCPLITKASREKVDTSRLHVRAGEYMASEAEELMNQDKLVEAACKEIWEYTVGRKAVLIFASGVAHGRHIAEVMERQYHVSIDTVFGDTLSFMRARAIEAFRKGELKYLVSMNVLTMGFDAPHIDCVALVRPTLSPGLYYQMAGRGFRPHPGKENCLILDFGGNVLRHGPVDQIRVNGRKEGNGEAPAKECPECHLVMAAGYLACPECGYTFPERQKTLHGPEATTADILSGEVREDRYEVQETRYRVHTRRGASEGDPKSMQVDYQISLNHIESEWICFEHAGFPRQKAEDWWWKRSHAPVPDTSEEAVLLAQDGRISETLAITVRTVGGEKYGRIVRYEIDEKPFYREPGWEDDEPGAKEEFCWIKDEEIPF